MPVITFWSSNEKTIGQTVSASLVATVMAMEHNYKVILISADFNDETMQNCFGDQESNKEILRTIMKRPQMDLESGINGLLKLADSNRVTPDIIHDYTKIIFKNRFEVLYTPLHVIEESKSHVMDNLKNIIINASRYYDYVIVDLKKGLKYKEQLEILQLTDVIVNDIDQGVRTIQKTLETKEVLEHIEKMVWNICKYDKKSKYTAKNITRNVLKKERICTIPYNTLVLEAAQEGKIIELIIRLKTLKDEDENLALMKDIKELIQGILLKYQEIQLRK